jgi:gliding motility-associated-like protein
LIFKDQGSCPAITTPAIIIRNTGGDLKLTTNKVSVTDESCERKNGSIQVQDISPTESGFSFTWIDDATGQPIGSGTSMSNLSAGNYDLQAIDATGCQQVVRSFNIVDDPAPTIDISSAVVKPDTCSQNNGSITGIKVQGTPTFTFAWYQTSGLSVAKTKNLLGISKGSYYLVVEDQNNCSTTSPVINVDNITPQLNAPMYDEIVILKGQTATLTAKDPEAGTYDLYATNPDNVAGSSAPTPIQTNATGEFTTPPLDADMTVYVVLRKGDCSSSAVAVNIKVLATQDIIVPNAFTPNGDGHNDLFRIKNPQLVKSFTMAIFNRWGEKVFETTDPYKGWDGSRNGLPVLSGVYVWTIDYTDILGSKGYKRGTLILVR